MSHGQPVNVGQETRHSAICDPGFPVDTSPTASDLGVALQVPTQAPSFGRPSLYRAQGVRGQLR